MDLLQICGADQDWVDAWSQRGGWRRGMRRGTVNLGRGLAGKVGTGRWPA